VPVWEETTDTVVCLELNHYRLKRGYPRGSPEHTFGPMRDQMGTAWLTAVQQCVTDVEIFQTETEHALSRQEEKAVQGGDGSGPGPVQSTRGAKL